MSIPMIDDVAKNCEQVFHYSMEPIPSLCRAKNMISPVVSQRGPIDLLLFLPCNSLPCVRFSFV